MRPRATVFPMMLLFVLPSDSSPQAVPSPGDRIRVEEVDGTVVMGTLATFSAETIQLSVDPSRVEGTMPIPCSEVGQEGTQGRGRAGSIIGLLVGGTIAVDTRDTNDCELGARGILSCMGGVVGRVVLGMAAGAVVGAIVGSAFRTGNRVIVPLIEVAPAGQGPSASVFGFGLRFARVRRSW